MQEDKHRGELSSKLGTVKVAPSAGLWDKIEAELTPEKKRRGVVWWWIGSGLAASFALVFVMREFSPNSTQTQLNTLNSKQHHQILSSNFHQKIESNQPNNQLETNLTVTTNSTPSNGSGVQNHQTQTSSTPSNGIDKTSQLYSNHQVTTTTRDRDRVEQLAVTNVKPITTSFSLVIPSSEINCTSLVSSIPFKSHWEFGIGSTHLMRLKKGENNQDIFVENGTLNNENTDPNNEIYDIQRIPSIDFLAGYRLKDRLKIGTGLQISKYRYKEAQFANWSTASSDQFKLWTLAVPISISYDWIKKKTFSLATDLSYINEFRLTQNNSLKNQVQSFEGLPASNKSKAGNYFGAAELSVAAYYHFTPFLSLRAATAFRSYEIQKVKKGNTAIPFNRFWWGGQIGLVFKLNPN